MPDEPKPTKKPRKSTAPKAKAGNGQCFVMMPIGERPTRSAKHWRSVYEQIFVPAIKEANYDPHLGSQTLETNIIQLDVLKRIIEAPMAICDISTHNPNVLFELGIRQAFDKPVVIVAEEGTENIFDISPLRYQPYRSSLLYEEVLQDQINIANVIKATKEAVDKGAINSLVRLLALQPAELPTLDNTPRNTNAMLRLVLAEIDTLKLQQLPGVPQQKSPSLSKAQVILSSIFSMPTTAAQMLIEAIAKVTNSTTHEAGNVITQFRKTYPSDEQLRHMIVKFVNDCGSPLKMQNSGTWSAGDQGYATNEDGSETSLFGQTTLRLR